jgi:hypothetical protein
MMSTMLATGWSTVDSTAMIAEIQCTTATLLQLCGVGLLVSSLSFMLSALTKLCPSGQGCLAETDHMHLAGHTLPLQLGTKVLHIHACSTAPPK